MALEIESHRNGPGKYQFWRLVGFPNPTDWIRLSPVSKCHFPRWISVHFPVQFYQTNSNQFPSEAALKRSNPLCPNRIESIESNLFIIIIIFSPFYFQVGKYFFSLIFFFFFFVEASGLPWRMRQKRSGCRRLVICHGLRGGNTGPPTVPLSSVQVTHRHRHTHTRAHTHTHTHKDLKYKKRKERKRKREREREKRAST